MRILPLGLLVFLFVAPAAADCLRPVVEPTRLALDAALPKADMATDVGAREAAAIALMKTRLRMYLAATAACGTEDPKALQTMLAGAAPKLDFTVRRFAPDLVAITASFPIQCGQDTMLSVFRHGREVLHAQSAPYKTIAGAWDMFGYEIAPPDKAGQWFAVTKTIAPWCSSTWSEIRYAVWRPGRAPALFQASDTIWWGNEDYGRLSVGAKDFTLRFHSSSIDDGRHDREWVRHFEVMGDKVVRVVPFANTAMDFVEEWIRSDWKAARGWTAPAVAPLVREVHTRFHAKPYGGFQSVRRCAGDTLEIAVEPGGAASSLFFQVTGTGDYQLTGLANTPRCTGKSIFDPDKPNWP